MPRTRGKIESSKLEPIVFGESHRRRCDCGGWIGSLHCTSCGKMFKIPHENSLRARQRLSLGLGIASLALSPLGIWLGVIFGASGLYFAVKSERKWLIVFNIIAVIVAIALQVWWLI